MRIDGAAAFAREPREAAHRQPADRLKILLVDDVPHSLTSLEAVLESLDEELVSATSGKEALRYLLSNDVAVILLDVKMPDMDGFETAELIRSRPRSRHTPILFLTGHSNEGHLLRGYKLGAVDFLVKPIVPDVLRSKISVFVELSRQAAVLNLQAKEMAEQAGALRRSELRFRSLLEAAPDAMVICRENQEVVLTNSRTETLFACSREEIVGRQISSLVPEWQPPVCSIGQEDLQYAFPSTSTKPHEWQATRKDGTIFPVEVSTSPLSTEEGLLIISAIRDISLRKQIEAERAEAEESLRLLNVHLEERVTKRTEQLQRSNEELAQFAYVASHDLREPIRTMALYTQLLRKRCGDALPEPGREAMTFIVESARRMEMLVQGLLQFCQIDNGEMESFATISADVALTHALSNIHASVKDSAATITWDTLPDVEADQPQLISIFQNLLTNAIRYRAPSRVPSIHISVTSKETEWLFAVRDNGIGIEPQYMERIFGIFKRLHGSENPGAGIGLAMCRKIIHRHGGRIWVDSKPNEGSTFYFTIPK